MNSLCVTISTLSPIFYDICSIYLHVFVCTRKSDTHKSMDFGFVFAYARLVFLFLLLFVRHFLVAPKITKIYIRLAALSSDFATFSCIDVNYFLDTILYSTRSFRMPHIRVFNQTFYTKMKTLQLFLFKNEEKTSRPTSATKHSSINDFV